MKKITLLLTLMTSFIWGQDITVTINTSEIQAGGVNLVSNYSGSWQEHAATDDGNDTWSYVIPNVAANATVEYVWKIYYTAGGNEQENLVPKIAGKGVDNNIAIGEPINTDYSSYCNRTVLGGQTTTPATYFFNSFRKPGVTYTELILNAASGGTYYIDYDVNSWSQYGGPGAIDNGDGTYTILVKPDAAFEYVWNNNTAKENLLTCTNDGAQINTDNSAYANRIHAAGVNDSDTFGTCPAPLNIDKFNLANISLYPSPAQNELNISANDTIKNAKIYNILGKVVKTISIDAKSKNIDVSQLTSGIYLIKYNVGDVTGTAKFIKE